MSVVDLHLALRLGSFGEKRSAHILLFLIEGNSVQRGIAYMGNLCANDESREKGAL